MKREKTPEEKLQSKRTNANVMIVCGAVMAICGLAGGIIALSGRGDVPDWMFGGKSSARAATGDWTNASPSVAFEDWGPSPFAKAKRENKLVLLFLGPAYSAPTARMAAETFSDPSVAALTDARFVSVRVDSAEFPDLDRRYRGLGWPTVALLMPDGVVLDAGTSMTPATFKRWAGAVADKAASHPELLSRADAEAAARRAAEASTRTSGRTPPSPAAAEADAQAALLAAWVPSRRTFDARGPRFPRFERIAALASLNSAWAKGMAAEAAKGALIFQDPRDGGFIRAANPDGTPAALEKTAAGQAAALDALCGPAPEAARRELEFLAKDFAPKGDAGWRGWQAGYALDAKRFKASDGPSFDRFRAEGWRELGPARLADDAELSRAVLACAVSPAPLKARARRTIARAAAAFEARARAKDPRLLLDDAVALGPALLAAGETRKAASVFKWMEDALGGPGPAYVDRLATGVLPPEADRLADPGLNAGALSFVRALASALPPGPDRSAASKRAEALSFWLSARPLTLDPAVWAALAAKEPR